MTDGGFFVGRLMFFIVSKTFGLMTVPSNLIVMMGLAGIALLFTRWTRTGQRLLVASVILIVAIGVLPLGTALMVPLEERFPPWDPERGTPTWRHRAGWGHWSREIDRTWSNIAR